MLKVLPEAFAADPARMARFQREAEVLASLNHPNIAHIYGVEERALVMELVEGQTLSEEGGSLKAGSPEPFFKSRFNDVPPVHAFTGGLLRGHVGGGAQNDSDACRRLRRSCSTNPVTRKWL